MDGSFDESVDTEPIVVRRYKNHRIYDTRQRCYVTLDELRRMVVQQTPFIVEDVETGEDVTEQTLLQIVVSEEQRYRPLMPVGFLGDVIRFYGEMSSATLRLYLDASMNAFVINQKQIRHLLATLQSDVFENPLTACRAPRRCATAPTPSRRGPCLAPRPNWPSPFWRPISVRSRDSFTAGMNPGTADPRFRPGSPKIDTHPAVRKLPVATPRHSPACRRMVTRAGASARRRR